MLVLDTNLLYYLCELSTPPEGFNARRVLDCIDAEEKVVISTVTWLEFLVHQRQHAKTIRRVSTFLKNHHVSLYPNQYFPLPENIHYLFTSTRQKDIDRYVRKILPMKASIESRFAAVLFIFIAGSAMYFESYKGDRHPDMSDMEIISVILSSYQASSVALFQQIYNEGYSRNDSERVITKNFNLAIQEMLPSYISVYNLLSAMDKSLSIIQKIQQIPMETWNYDSLVLRKKVDKLKAPMQYLKKLAKKYAKCIDDEHLSHFLTTMWGTIQQDRIVADPVYEYLFRITRSFFLDGATFHKNDINDALILSSISDGDRIITFDTGMKKHMAEYSKTNPTYAASLQLISTL